MATCMSSLVATELKRLKGRSFGCLNINSLGGQKLTGVKLLLEISDLDFLLLCKTKLGDNTPDAAIHIDGFNLFRKNRNNDG